MRRQYLIIFIIGLFVLGIAACDATTNSPAAPTAIPFPTVTIGYALRGDLSTPQSASNAPVSNPATVEALSRQLTPTPNTGACPALSANAAPGPLPAGSGNIANEIVRFLSAGGSAVALETVMRDEWDILGESGFLRSDIDLTGDGVPEVIAGYRSPGEGGALLIAGCETGRYLVRHQAFYQNETPPALILLGDITYDGLNNVVFTHQVCDEDSVCQFQTSVLAWNVDEWRFVNLLSDTIDSDQLPEVMDMDNDQVGEIVVRMESYGTLATGPLRTGIHIYDWNGSFYVLSIVQLNPPRYRIQIIFAADRQFASGNMDGAIQLYQQALTDEDLGTWLNDEKSILDGYILYRMLVARVVNGDSEAEAVYQVITTDLLPQSEQEPPIYVNLSQAFWDTFQTTSDLATACGAVQTVIEQRPEAVELLNRYGSRNPTYTARDSCPY